MRFVFFKYLNIWENKLQIVATSSQNIAAQLSIKNGSIVTFFFS